MENFADAPCKTHPTDSKVDPLSQYLLSIILPTLHGQKTKDRGRKPVGQGVREGSLVHKCLLAHPQAWWAYHVMRTREIENQIRQRPFVPFRLRMTDGTAFEVRHPEMLLVSRTILVLALDEGPDGRPEGFVFCDPVHIIRIEPVVDGRSRARRSSAR